MFLIDAVTNYIVMAIRHEPHAVQLVLLKGIRWNLRCAISTDTNDRLPKGIIVACYCKYLIPCAVDIKHIQRRSALDLCPGAAVVECDGAAAANTIKIGTAISPHLINPSIPYRCREIKGLPRNTVPMHRLITPNPKIICIIH